MDINELQSYRLSDAIKFNDRLNARLWGEDERLLPEVRKNLLKIAQDFQEFLGVSDLDIRDITLSGSNAAYTYTDHSDIDLHLVVDMPRANDEVYRELFNAKKYQYNDEHNYRIGPYDIELYVQDADAPHVSQGIYSIMQDQWLQVPRRRRPEVDDVSVRSKYEDLGARIEQAVESGDLERMDQLWNKIKDMRQSGLEQTGEFGPENLAFKLLRANGEIARLKQARLRAQDERLSLEERKKKKRRKPRTRYAYGGWWYPGFGYGSSDSGEGDSGGDGGGGESLGEAAAYWQWIRLPMPEFDFPVYVKFADDRVLIGTENMEIEGEAPGRFYLGFSADLATGRLLDTDADWNRNEPFDIMMVDQGVLQDIVEEVLTAVGRRWGTTADAIRAELEGGIEIDEDLERFGYLWYFDRERWGGLYSRGQEDAKAKLPADPGYGGMGGGSGLQKIRLQGSMHMDPDLRQAMRDEYMAGYNSVEDPDAGGLAVDVDEALAEDRASDEHRKAQVRLSDAIDAMINRLVTAKIYVMVPDGRRDEAQGAISDVMSKFLDTFEGKISREKYEDFIVPLDWCMDALANETWDGQVVNQTIDISINLLDEMNDQIWREINRAKDDDEGGIEIDLTENKVTLTTEQIKKFVKAAARMLKMPRTPKMRLHRNQSWAAKNNSFGRYDHESKTIELSLYGRHAADILRTLAHELTHARQDQISKLPPHAGETGSPWEDEANAMAGRIMRHWTDLHPEVFERNLTEGIIDSIPRSTRRAIAGMCAVAGLSGCVTMDQLRTVQTLGRAVTSMERYGAAGAQEEITQELKNYIRARGGDEGAQNQSRIYRWERQQQQTQTPTPVPANKLPPRVLSREPQKEDYDPDHPPGPEFKPTMPAGTARVDVSDVYDWYKLGQHISNLKGLGRHDFGQGPPSAIIAFGSEDAEHKYIQDLEKTGLKTTDIDPAAHKKIKGQKTDPTYNVAEASGFVPVNKQQAKDPRYAMAITRDVQPGETQRQARKMGFKTNAAGVPPLLVKGLRNALREFKETGTLREKCWTGYRQVGMKKKGSRQVPNCVPVSENQAQSFAVDPARLKVLYSKIDSADRAQQQGQLDRAMHNLQQANHYVYELFAHIRERESVAIRDAIGDVRDRLEYIKQTQAQYDIEDMSNDIIDIGINIEMLHQQIAQMKDDPGGIEIDVAEATPVFENINLLQVRKLLGLIDRAATGVRGGSYDAAIRYLNQVEQLRQEVFDVEHYNSLDLQNEIEWTIEQINDTRQGWGDYDQLEVAAYILELKNTVNKLAYPNQQNDSDPGGIEIDVAEATGDPAFDRMMAKLTAATQDINELPDEHLKDTEYQGIRVTSAVYPNPNERWDTIRWRGTVDGQPWEANGTPSALYLRQGPKKKQIAAILHHLNANQFPWDLEDVKVIALQRWQQIRETAVGVPPVGPALPIPNRRPRRQPPWPGPGERRKIAEIAGDRVYLQFADVPGPEGSSLRWYAAPDRAIRYRDATLTGTVTEPADILKALQNLVAKQGFDSVSVVMDPKLIARYPRDLHIFKQMADEGWFEDVPGLEGRVKVAVTGEYPSMTAIRGGWQRTRPVTPPQPVRAQQMPGAESDVPVGRDGLVRFKLPRAWFDAIVQSDNPQFTQYLRKATREEGGKYFQMTPQDFRAFKNFVTGWDFVSQAQAIIDQAYAKVPAGQRPSALVRFYFKGQPGADAI